MVGPGDFKLPDIFWRELLQGRIMAGAFVAEIDRPVPIGSSGGQGAEGQRAPENESARNGMARIAAIGLSIAAGCVRSVCNSFCTSESINKGVHESPFNYLLSVVSCNTEKCFGLASQIYGPNFHPNSAFPSLLP